MADNTVLDAGSGGDTIATDDIGGVKFPRSKIVIGADGTNDGDVAKANPLPVGINTVKDGSGTVYAPLSDADGHQQVDIVGALPAGTNAIGKLAANDGVDIGDVDVASLPSGSVAATTAKTGDYDSGGGTDTVMMTGIALPASGGAVAGGTSTDPLRTDPTGTTTQPVSGTVTADAGTGPWPVTDNGGALTVDNGGTFAVQVDAALPAGTNAIGKLAANDGVDIGDVDVASLPSGSVAAATATTKDYDTGGGTDTVVGFGLLLPKSGGSVAGGTSTDPVRTDPTGTTTQPVSGTVTADAGTGPWPVTDNSGSLTVDAPTGTPVNVQVGDGTLQATVRDTGTNDSLNVAIVDAAGDQITSFGGGTQYAVDDALGATPTGTLSLAKRDDALSALTPVEADAVELRVDANGALWVIPSGTVTVDNGGTFAVQVDAALPAGTNAIGKLAENSGVDIGDVDVLSVIPGTGATNLGKAEDAAHTTGDVGVMSLGVRKDTGATIAGTDGDYTPFQVDASGNLRVNVAAGSAAGTEYTEDDAAPANPDGGAVALVRQDTPATLTSADGDIVAQRATNYGAAFVQILDSSGNFINSFGGSGGTSHADDAAFTIGSASSVTPTAYLADETTPDSVDEGDVGVPRMTLSRKPYAVITDASSENNAAVDGSGHLQVDIAADSVGIGGGTQYTEDDASVANPVGNQLIGRRRDSLSSETSADGDVVALNATDKGELYVKHVDAVPVTDNGGNLSVDWGGTVPPIGAGTEAAALRVTLATDSTGVVSVDDNGGALTVDNGGTFAVQVDAALPAGTNNIGDVDVASQVPGTGATNLGKAVDDAAGATDTGVATLAVRDDALATLTPVDGDYTPLRTNNRGAQWIVHDGDVNIADGGNVISTDWNGTAPPIGAGTEAAALRVTLATDSTGVVSIDDNAGSLTVDSSDLVTIAGAVSGTEMQCDVLTQPARAATTDTIGAQLQSNSIMDGTTEATPKYAEVDVAASGDNSIVAAVVGKKIRVLSYTIVASAALTAEWRDGTTPVSGGMQLAANSGVGAGFSPVGHFETSVNTALQLNLSAASSVDGHLVYIEVD